MLLLGVGPAGDRRVDLRQTLLLLGIRFRGHGRVDSVQALDLASAGAGIDRGQDGVEQGLEPGLVGRALVRDGQRLVGVVTAAAAEAW